MDQKQSNRLSAKHTLAVMLALIGGGLLVWIIQLARQGDPIGYIILTGLGVLASLPVVGGVLSSTSSGPSCASEAGCWMAICGASAAWPSPSWS